MNKKIKYVLIGAAAIIIVLLIVLFVKKGSKVEDPINKVIEGVNENKIDYIVDSYHEYCREEMQSRYSEEVLNEYKERMTNEVGKGAKIISKVISTEEVSDEDLEFYYGLALSSYSQYPYLQNNELSFDAMYSVKTELSMKGGADQDKAILEWQIVESKGHYYLYHQQYNNPFLLMFME